MRRGMKGIFHFSLSPGKKILGEAVPRGVSQLFSVNWACGVFEDRVQHLFCGARIHQGHCGGTQGFTGWCLRSMWC